MSTDNQGHWGIRLTEGYKNRENKSKPIKERSLLGKKKACFPEETQKPANRAPHKRTGNFDLLWMWINGYINASKAKQTKWTTFQVGTKLCFVIFIFVFQFISHWRANVNDHFICCWQIRKLSPILSLNISIHLSGAVLITSGWISLSSLLHKVDIWVSTGTFRLKKRNNLVVYICRVMLNWMNPRHFSLPGIFV